MPLVNKIDFHIKSNPVTNCFEELEVYGRQASGSDWKTFISQTSNFTTKFVKTGHNLGVCPFGHLGQIYGRKP